MNRDQKTEFLEKKRAIVQAKLEQARLKESGKGSDRKAREECEDAFAAILKEQHKLRAQEAEENALREVATLCRTQLNDPPCIAAQSYDTEDDKLEHADTYGFFNDEEMPTNKDQSRTPMISATS